MSALGSKPASDRRDAGTRLTHPANKREFSDYSQHGERASGSGRVLELVVPIEGFLRSDRSGSAQRELGRQGAEGQSD